MEDKYYPRHVFHAREDLTRNAMKEYDAKKKRFYDKCLEINPDYYKLALRDRIDIWGKAETELGFRI